MSTFWRLLGFLRPYRRGVIWSFGLAFGALVGTVLIPYLTGVAINAIRAHDHHELILLALAITGAGLARLVLSVFRRLVAGRSRWASSSTCATASTASCSGSSCRSSTASRPAS